MTYRHVPRHDINPSGPVRRPLVRLLGVTGLWFLLPGRVQGALCDCPIDRGTNTDTDTDTRRTA